MCVTPRGKAYQLNAKKGGYLNFAGTPCFYGYWEYRLVYMIITGVGKEYYRNRFQKLLQGNFCPEIIFLGTAGAVNSSLKIGDVIIANQGISWQYQNKETEKFYWVHGANCNMPYSEGINRKFGKYNFKIYSGCIISWDDPVFDGDKKSLLYVTSNADCVDMESGYGVRICEQMGIPSLVIRGISDLSDFEENGDRLVNLQQAIIHSSFVAWEVLCFRGSLSEWIKNLQNRR